MGYTKRSLQWRTNREEDDFVSHAELQESHTEVEDSQDDCVYEAASDHVFPANDVDLVMFDDDSCNIPNPPTGEEDATTCQNIWASSPMNMYTHNHCWNVEIKCLN